MKPTFEEIQLIVSTAMLLPALLALIVFALRRHPIDEGEQWSPVNYPERDWWTEEDSA